MITKTETLESPLKAHRRMKIKENSIVTHSGGPSVPFPFFLNRFLSFMKLFLYATGSMMKKANFVGGLNR